MGWRGAGKGNHLHGYSKRIHMLCRKAVSMLRHGMCVEIDTWNMLNILRNVLCVRVEILGGVAGKGAKTFMDTVNAYECADEEQGCYIMGYVLN